MTSALALIVPSPKPIRFWPEGTKGVYQWNGSDWVPILMQHLRAGDLFKMVDKEGVISGHNAAGDPVPHLGEGRYGIMAWDAPYLIHELSVSNE